MTIHNVPPRDDADDGGDEIKSAKYLRSNDYMRAGGGNDDWLVEEKIERNALIGLAGKPSMAKSYLAMDLADCISRGVP